MCYSAQVWADYKLYQRNYDVDISIEDFAALFYARLSEERIKVPKAMEVAFESSSDPETAHIREWITQYKTAQASRLEQELFKQKKRLADAQRTLQTRTTKAATDSQRIASNKIDWCLDKLADLRRSDLKDSDSRIYPGYYAPVMVMENSKRTIKPMRYQCRPAGKPALYDTKYPGTYNARRDNLEGFWKGQFGYSHGLIVVNAFYEHVSQSTGDGIASVTKNVILEFKPNPTQAMLVACLWSKWSAEGEPDLLSFAAITDEPPAEVADAGHDRCIIPIKEQHINAWLNPDPRNWDALYSILDDRERPYFEHRLAA